LRPQPSEEIKNTVEDICTEDCDWVHDNVTGKYIIPFKLDDRYPIKDERRIRLFINRMSLYTNFLFIPLHKLDPENNPGYYVYIYDGGRCRNRFGRAVRSGPQMMSIAREKCTDFATLSREFGHLFGLRNEHQRYDRDRYLRVDFYELDRRMMNYIEKIPFPDNRVGRILATYEYDMASITHCNATEFSESENPSILPINERFLASVENTRTLFSSCDWNKILTLYPGQIKPPPCIYNYRGYQYRHTSVCHFLYGVRTCRIACYFAGGRLIPYGLCEYANGLYLPPLPAPIKMDPFFATDADVSEDGMEYRARLYLILHDKDTVSNYFE
jgi:hypothetical protein